MLSKMVTLSKNASMKTWFTHALNSHNTPAYRTARWFFRDFVVRYRWRLSAITLVGFAAAGLQGVALGGLHRVTSMSSDASVTIPLLEIPLMPSQLAPAVAGLIILALVLSAVLTFVQGREVLNLWQRYQVHAVNTLFEAVARVMSQGRADEASVREVPIMAALRQSQRLGAFTRVVAGGIAPALRFIVFAGIAVILNPDLTFILFIVAIPSGIFTLMLFARGASRSARRAAELGQDAAKDLEQRLSRTFQFENALMSNEPSRRDSPFVDRVEAMTRRIYLVEQAKFTTAAIALLVSGGFLVYGSYSGALDAANWSQHFAYLLALLMAFSQLISLASSLSSCGRFYPAVSLHKDILELLDQATSPEHLRRMLKSRGMMKAELSDDDEMME